MFKTTLEEKKKNRTEELSGLKGVKQQTKFMDYLEQNNQQNYGLFKQNTIKQRNHKKARNQRYNIQNKK